MTLVEALVNLDGVEHVDAREGGGGDVAIAIGMMRRPSTMDVERIMGALESFVPSVCRVACLVTSPPGRQTRALESANE